MGRKQLITDEEFLNILKGLESEVVTFKQLMDLTGYWSTSPIATRLLEFERKGLIERTPISGFYIEVKGGIEG